MLFAWERVAELDVRLVTWTHEHSPAELVDAMRVLTYAGNGVVLAGVALAAALVLARRGGWAAALFVPTAYAGAQVLDLALKLAFRRARPEFSDPYVLLTTYSFPSGHAFAATATYGALALLALATVSRRAERTTIALGATALIVLVAASRVVLGVHYLGDVVGGILAAAAWLCACLLALPCGRRVTPAPEGRAGGAHGAPPAPCSGSGASSAPRRSRRERGVATPRS